MNLPSEFENYTRDLLGDALYSRLREGLAEAPSPTSIRLNPFKAASREVNGLLMGERRALVSRHGTLP